MTLPLALLLTTGIPAATDGMPNRQPELAAGNGIVALVFGSGHAVMFARSNDGGRTFSKAVAIAEPPVLALGRHRGPRIVFAGKAIVVSAVGGEALAAGEHAHGLPSDGNLLAWRSTDGGKTWLRPVTINDAPGSAREGLHAMAADREGHLAAVWLDLRSPGTRLYGAFSNDAGATWSKNLLVYESPGGTICQCCHPSLTELGNGEFAVMFRNVQGDSRDMFLLKLRDGRVVSPPVKAGNGTWKINACPMDGGGLALSGGRMVTAWRRGEEVFLAKEGDAEVRIGAGKDVALAAAGEKVFAIWNEAGGIAAWVSGQAEALSRTGAFPALTSLPDGGALAAWEEEGGIALRRLQ